VSKSHNVTLRLPAITFNQLQQVALQTKLPLNDVISSLLFECVRVMQTKKEETHERADSKSGQEEVRTGTADSI